MEGLACKSKNCEYCNVGRQHQRRRKDGKTYEKEGGPEERGLSEGTNEIRIRQVMCR